MESSAKHAYDEDRTYHGINRRPMHVFHLVVELSEFGPTERKVPYQLRELSSEVCDQFGWGYNGAGTSATADAILRDALNINPEQQLPRFVREDFCEDVVAHFTDEFRIRRGAVLRWFRGWAAENHISVLPEVMSKPLPVRRSEYERRPQAVLDRHDELRRRQ